MSLLQQRIILPRSIILSFDTLNKILYEFNSVSIDIGTTVYLDFTETEWIDGELTTLLGILATDLSSKGFEVYVVGILGNAKTILGKNKFLESHGLGESIVDNHNSTIPYVMFSSSNVKKIRSYLDDIVFTKIDEHMDEIDLNIIRESIFELLQNVKDHSESDRVLLCGQYFHKKKKIELAFADPGVSIPTKVQRTVKLKSDYDCIDWATLKGNSTKEVLSSGLGLFELRENIVGLGEMIIISRKGYWQIDSQGKLKGKNMEFQIPGTLINLTFYLPDNVKRKKKIDIIDCKETISDIAF